MKWSLLGHISKILSTTAGYAFPGFVLRVRLLDVPSGHASAGSLVRPRPEGARTASFTKVFLRCALIIMILALSEGRAAGPVHRHLSFLEGNIQRGFPPKRGLASKNLKAWEGDVPSFDDTERYVEYLVFLFAAGKPELESKLQAFLARHPEEKKAVFLLGSHFLRAGNLDLAHHLLMRLEKDEGFGWKALLYNNLGMLALRDANRDLALGYFEKAFGTAPRAAAPYVNAGAIHLQGRNFVKSESLFLAATQIDDGFEDAVLGLGASLEGQGKFDEAWKLYEAYSQKHSEAVSVLFNASLVLGNRLNRPADARELMRRYIQKGGKETASAQKMMETWR